MLRPALFLLSLFATAIGQAHCLSEKTSSTAPLVDGCKLLKNPALFDKRMVRVAGTVTSGFERFDLTFKCPGRLNLNYSLYWPDKKKYGFLSDANADSNLSSHLGMDTPTPNNVMNRETHKVRVVVTGLFRCHYDFPNCKNLTGDGDSSIVIKSLSVPEATSAVPH